MFSGDSYGHKMPSHINVLLLYIFICSWYVLKTVGEVMLKNMQMHCPLPSSPPDVDNEDEEHDGNHDDDVSRQIAKYANVMSFYVILYFSFVGSVLDGAKYANTSFVF